MVDSENNVVWENKKFDSHAYLSNGMGIFGTEVRFRIVRLRVPLSDKYALKIKIPKDIVGQNENIVTIDITPNSKEENPAVVYTLYAILILSGVGAAFSYPYRNS